MTSRSRRFHVYVIDLDGAAWTKRTRRPARLVYVGSSAFSPAERFRRHQHKRGGGHVVKHYGVGVAWDLTPRTTWPTRAEAKRAERALAERLNATGRFAVWTG